MAQVTSMGNLYVKSVASITDKVGLCQLTSLPLFWGPVSFLLPFSGLMVPLISTKILEAGMLLL